MKKKQLLKVSAFIIFCNLIVTTNIFAKSMELSCQIDIRSNFKNRKPLSYPENIIIPISNDIHEQHIILESEELNKQLHKTIVFLGNATEDPLTGARKIFIGMYQSSIKPISKDPKDVLFNLPFSVYYQNKNGQLSESTEYGLPIVSAVSDSDSIEIFSASYGDAQFKMNCVNPRKPVFISSLYPAQGYKEKFLCNISLKNRSSRQVVDEQRKEMTFGFSYNNRSNLQPIIEDNMFDRVLPRARIMGKLSINPKTGQPEFLLGIYRMNKMYDPSLHTGFYVPKNQTPDPSGRPTHYGLPIAEVRTSSDYAELRSSMALKGYSFKAECKKVGNRILWSQEI